MSPSKKNKDFLFQKYVSGDISREEMHLLNQYALEDDFLFEALEGVSNFEKTSAEAIQDLSTRISVKKKKRRRPIVLYWLGAAASIAIIILSVTFFNDGFNKAINEELVADQILKPKSQIQEENLVQAPVEDDREDESAAAEKAPNDKMVLSRAEVETEGVATAGVAEIISDEQIISHSEEIVLEETKESNFGLVAEDIVQAEPEQLNVEPAPPPPPVVAVKPSIAGLESKKIKKVSASSPSAARKRSNKLDSESLAEVNFSGIAEESSPLLITGKVSTKDGEPIFGSTIYSPTTNIVSNSDLDGRFKLEVPDSNSEIIVNALGYSEKSIVLESLNEVNVILETKPITSVEIAIINDLSGSNLDIDESRDFKNYAANQIQLSDEVLNQVANKHITLEFDIDKNGKADNITIIDSIGYSVEDEVIKTVAGYNKWKVQIGFSKMKKKLKLLFTGKKK